MLIKQKDTHLYPTVQTIDQTIVKLLSGNYSIARYGDGEYTLCFDRPIGFQKADKRLRNRLREILKSDSSFCIIAIPEFKPEEISPFWIRYWYENFYFIVKLFRKDAVYYNQSISRDFTLDQIHKLKQLWKNRFVVFICGKGSRFDVTHELFADIDGYTIVFGLALNAFVEYNSLLERTYIVLSKFENPLVLIALGPTATVLAYDLSQKGYQALDIGHVTNMYDKLVFGKAKPEDLPYNSVSPTDFG